MAPGSSERRTASLARLKTQYPKQLPFSLISSDPMIMSRGVLLRRLFGGAMNVTVSCFGSGGYPPPPFYLLPLATHLEEGAHGPAYMGPVATTWVLMGARPCPSLPLPKYPWGGLSMVSNF